jgi:dTDP-4-dehydrorhamnose reductase
MRILITGAGGQLGRDLADVWGDHHEVVPCGREQLDLSSRDSVLSAICSVQPDAIVHGGAWTAVDACESDPDRAFQVNSLGTRHVADGARIVGARVLYVSTDYVFDGRERERPYTEWDEPNPVSVYGRSKLGGERELDPATSTIVRTSWVCGFRGKNFVKTMLRLAGERETWGVVNDQRGCPTFTSDLAQMIRRLVVGRLPGVFHVSNSGETTWFELARATLEYAGLDPERVQPISTADYPTPAPRPAYSVLDNAAMRLQGIPLLPDWHEPLERLVKELTS